MTNKIISFNFDSIFRKTEGGNFISDILKNHLKDKVYIILYELRDEFYSGMNGKQIVDYVFDKLGAGRDSVAGIEVAESGLIMDTLKKLNVDIHYDGDMDVIISCKAAKINAVFLGEKEEKKKNSNLSTTFKAKRKDLLATLKRMKSGLRGDNKKALRTSCEITVTDGKVNFVVPGAEFFLLCATQGGAARATLPYLYFADIVQNLKGKEAEFKITEDEINVGILTFRAATCFFEDDKILRTIQLPLNYTDADVLRLRNGQYTQEELDFNNMFPKIEKAEKNLEHNLYWTYRKIHIYGVQYEELEELVKKKLSEKS